MCELCSLLLAIAPYLLETRVPNPCLSRRGALLPRASSTCMDKIGSHTKPFPHEPPSLLGRPAAANRRGAHLKGLLRPLVSRNHGSNSGCPWRPKARKSRRAATLPPSSLECGQGPPFDLVRVDAARPSQAGRVPSWATGLLRSLCVHRTDAQTVNCCWRRAACVRLRWCMQPRRGGRPVSRRRDTVSSGPFAVRRPRRTGAGRAAYLINNPPKGKARPEPHPSS